MGADRVDDLRTEVFGAIDTLRKKIFGNGEPGIDEEVRNIQEANSKISVRVRKIEERHEGRDQFGKIQGCPGEQMEKRLQDMMLIIKTVGGTMIFLFVVLLIYGAIFGTQFYNLMVKLKEALPGA